MPPATTGRFTTASREELQLPVDPVKIEELLRRLGGETVFSETRWLKQPQDGAKQLWFMVDIT